jgi:RimJ/RimL family protein N-acetyltransferase
VLTSMTRQAAAALAEALAARGRPLTGLNADQANGGAFVAVWQARTGDQPRIRRHSRLYRLGTLAPPRPSPAGRARVATAGDRDLLLAWHVAFHREAQSGPAAGEAIVDDRLSYGGITLWETAGTAVSMAGVTRLLAGHVRVAPVYTPPQWRGHGYAAAVTSAVSQAALDAGARDVVLFTDLANATSNALYQRIGYRPVADRVEWSFGPARHGRTAEGM